MHELSLMHSLWQLAQAEAQRHGGGAVRRLSLRIGTLAGVDPEALRLAFAVLLEEPGEAGPRLEIETVTAEARCLACGQRFTCADGIDPCPACGSFNSSLLRGRELDLVSLELDDLDADEPEGR